MARVLSYEFRARLPACVGSQELSARSANIDTVKAMTDRLRHRGPDGAGVWSAPGRRPRPSPSVHPGLVACGRRADGVRRARAHLQRRDLQPRRRCAPSCPGPWRSTGDTEVLLHLLARYGNPASPRRSACSPSRAGMPVPGGCCWRVTASASSRCTTSSCPTASRSPPNSRRCWCSARRRSTRGALRDYLFHGYVPAPKTIFRGISKLPAGHTLMLGGRARLDRTILGALGRVRLEDAGRYRRAARRAAAHGRAGAHAVGCSRGRFPERRHRLLAHRLLSGSSANLQPGVRRARPIRTRGGRAGPRRISTPCTPI